MARRKVTHYVDDLDHTPLADGEVHTVRFSVEGTRYRLDLSADNAARFHADLAPYIQASRAASAAQSEHLRPRDIREWARSRGIPIASRGKIPRDIITAYQQATHTEP